MGLSHDIISEFVKITNDNKEKPKEGIVYATIVQGSDGKYVKIDGSDLLTPADTTTDIEDGERVTVMIKDHKATVTGNVTAPSASGNRVDKVVETVTEQIGVFETVVADKVSVNELEAYKATIENLIVGKADIEDLEATNAVIENLKVKDAEIENAIIDKADIEDLEAVNAVIEDLKVKDAEIENAVIGNLEATKAEIGILEADFAQIKTLVSGNLTSDNILSFNITADKVTMEDAFIKDAMIDTVSAAKINAGKINTNSVTIGSEDGGMLIAGATQQFTDKNGNVRIQIGRDASDDFTFALYGEDGQGQLINQNGITASAIADGLIVNDMVSNDAAISGDKLDISSVVTEINNDNTTTIKSNKIYLDEQNQSLEVAFNKLKTQVDTIKDVDVDGELTTITEKVQSNTVKIEANTSSINTLISEDSAIKKQVSDLEGNVVETTNSLNSKYTSLNQSLDGFKTTVANTYATKSSVNDVKNNLSTNYSTTSAMNSAINQKVDEITASVSSTYATKNEVQSIDDNIKSNYSTTEQMESAISVAKDEINLGISKVYETKTNVESKISSSASSTLTNAKSYADTKKSEAISTASSDATSKANNALTSAKSYTDTAKNALNTEIGKKANSADVYTKTQTYTKTEVDSAIKLSKDAIELGISQKYETKEEVTNKVTTVINNINIGDRNLIRNGNKEYTNNAYRTVTYTPSSFLEKGETYTIVLCVTPAAGVQNFSPYLSSGYTRQCLLPVSGTNKQILSASFKASYTTGREPSDNINYGRLEIYRFPNNGTVTTNSTIHWCKVVKGNKTSLDFTPAPEDIDSSIQSISSSLESFENTVNGTFKDGIVEQAEARAIEQNINILNNEKADIDKEYSSIYNNSNLSGTAKTNLNSAYTSYTSAHTSLISTINTAISDGRTNATEKASVNSTFTTYKGVLATYKQRVQEALDYISSYKVDNIQVGSRNYFLNSSNFAMSPNNTGTGNSVKKTDESDVYYRATPSSGKTISLYKSITKSSSFKPNGTDKYVISLMVRSQKDATITIYDDAHSLNRNDLSVKANTWTKISTIPYMMTRSQNLILRSSVVDSYLDYKMAKLELGNKATDFTVAPEDIDTAIATAETNAVTTSKNYADSQIKIAKDSIELGVSQTYETKTSVSSQVSTALTNAKSYADTKKSEAISTASSDATSKANNALTSAKSYADTKKSEAITSANNTLNTTIANYYTKTQTDSAIKLAKDSVTTQVGKVEEIASSSLQGKMLYTDPTFTSGVNDMKVYNNSGNGTVTITRITKSSDCPTTSGYMMQIKTTGTASPGHGGFYFGTQTRNNAIFVTKIIAKIPSGYTLNFATNGIGTGGDHKWLTANSGTGNWKEYIYKVTCGNGGTLSSTNFFCVSGGGTATTSAPVTWYVAMATTFDITATDNIEKRMNTAEQKITSTAITNTVKQNFYTKTETDGKVTTVQNNMQSSITQLSNQIATKVDVNGVLSTIQQNPNSIQIGFNKISNALTIDSTGMIAKAQNGNKYYQLGYNGITMYNPANGTHEWGRISAINSKFTVASNGNSSGLSLGHFVSGSYVEDILCSSTGVVHIQRQMNHNGILYNNYGHIIVRQSGQGGWEITGRSDSQAIKPGGSNQGAIGSNTQYINQSWIANRYNPSSLKLKHLSHYIDDLECLKLVNDVKPARYFYKEYNENGDDVTTFTSRTSQLGLIYEDVRACSGRDLITNEEDAAINLYGMVSVLWGAVRNLNNRLNNVEYENVTLKNELEEVKNMLNKS